MVEKLHVLNLLANIYTEWDFSTRKEQVGCIITCRVNIQYYFVHKTHWDCLVCGEGHVCNNVLDTLEVRMIIVSKLVVDAGSSWLTLFAFNLQTWFLIFTDHLLLLLCCNYWIVILKMYLWQTCCFIILLFTCCFTEVEVVVTVTG